MSKRRILKFIWRLFFHIWLKKQLYQTIMYIIWVEELYDVSEEEDKEMTGKENRLKKRRRKSKYIKHLKFNEKRNGCFCYNWLNDILKCCAITNNFELESTLPFIKLKHVIIYKSCIHLQNWINLFRFNAVKNVF